MDPIKEAMIREDDTGERDKRLDPWRVDTCKCQHIPMKAALDSSVWCIRCAAYLGETQ